MAENNKNSTSFVKMLKLNSNSKELLAEALDGNIKAMDKFLEIKTLLSSGTRAIIVNLNEECKVPYTYKQIQKLNLILGKHLGELLPQNEVGDLVVSVYDRDRSCSMWRGARYHQTREGGSIHTDNVNIPEVWDYLYFSCLSPALVGGENILVDGVALHRELREKYPDCLKTLEGPFFWEMRGLSNELYQAPIITYDKFALPLFRHLRPYMESAHQKANVALTDKQYYALDVLDAIANSSEFQFRYKMKAADFLITKDAQVLHGRTCFSDHIDAIAIDHFTGDEDQILKRTMERLWIRK